MIDKRHDAINDYLDGRDALRGEVAPYWEDHTKRLPIGRKACEALALDLVNRVGLDLHQEQEIHALAVEVMKVEKKRVVEKRRRDHKAAKAARKTAARRAKKGRD